MAKRVSASDAKNNFGGLLDDVDRRLRHLRVIHPLDVLDSRIQNLHLLLEKRNDAGIAQAQLAVQSVLWRTLELHQRYTRCAGRKS
jgi:hypothetical protein